MLFKKRQNHNMVDRVVQQYGDLLYDLCLSILWSPANAQMAFRSILREVRRGSSRHNPKTYERHWVLQVAYRRLIVLAQRLGRRMTPSEQIMLDATLDTTARFKQFDSYFHRLPTEDQLLLLLRDKYGLPYPEIASVTRLPEGSLKVRRQQALRTMEDWIWTADETGGGCRSDAR